MDGIELVKANATKEILKKVSPSFCTVKWKHATLNLGSGAVKSCCHLPFRKVDLNSLSSGHQLHDTHEDRKERSQMLKGEKPKDCSYCWWMEDQGHLSDRIVWSSKSWMSPFNLEPSNYTTPEAKAPTWLELNFSNTCNLKCSYCSPIFSSKWQQEIKEHGPYPTTPKHNDTKYLQGVELDEKFDNTELMKQFWPWFAEIYPQLHLLKITGGEPFLSPHTFKLLEWVLKNTNPKLTLSINSNLSVPDSTWQQFMNLVVRIKNEKPVEKFYLHPSIDCFGERAEYIRHGLNFKIFQNHVEDYLERSGGNLVFICTINNLALAGLTDLWRYILVLKKRFGPRGQWISITSEVLHGPDWQNINILPESFQSYLLDTIEFANENIGNGFEYISPFELHGLTRALDMMKKPAANLELARQNFQAFFKEHDKRRSTNFAATFPEFKDQNLSFR